MAIRYSADFLYYLRDSPLCVKPANLPPAEEWMGPPPEQTRTQNKTTSDRPRSNDNSFLDQMNRRTTHERHAPRNTANPDEIVFAPPRMAFASARGNKSIDDKTPKESEAQGRFGNFRSRNGDADGDRFRETRNANGLRRRDGEGESDGWSTVKPRKSFGHDGAERFHGRMGGNFRDDKRQPREGETAIRDRPARGFENFTRDREADDAEGRPRNGLNRTKNEPWFKTEPATESHVPEKRERIDRAKNWRERDRDSESFDDRNNNRNNDRRWGRDHSQRVEREPEWMDEPLEEQNEAHTQQDFQKWMEEMKKAKNGGTPSASSKPTAEAAVAAIEAERPPVQSAPAAESGPDKFFLAFGGSKSGLDASTPNESADAANKSKTVGKSSRFTSFFSHPQEEVRGKTEPATPMVNPPMSAPLCPCLCLYPSLAPCPQILMKLQKQTMSATPPGPSPFALPPQGTPSDIGKPPPIASPEVFQQFGGDRRMEGPPMARPPPQHVQEILAPRPQPQSARPDQLLQDLVGQRQRAPSQPSGRPEIARNNSNAEFLMNLMRGPPADAQRNEMMMRMQAQGHPQKQVQMPPPLNDREPDFPRDQRQMRPQPPPGFPMDEPFRNPDPEGRPNQPTQILQRPPPPPGLDQMPPNWMPGGAQMPPPGQRGPMMAPPGLASGLGPGGHNRNMPMPPHMFPPNFPPGAMPPPEAMGGMPPRFNGPPGPEFGGAPFEGRGMPPAGNPGRGAAYGRQ
ncbi:hypothetical protein B0T10DRAFT_455888 [Thelonectria olida]|uniref:Uncharacterized protein n=1 Tax=Thelonectria olida TaxID=1576542 RepID=A0A9P8WBT7_9HYPO|nr:hypothetical protein B0T10DRAFT_455888 [Thelonectria olida]